ncbi:F-box domain containing protein [Tanacetum coccineum]
MNDKSKDTAKARQDLQMLGIRSGLWLSQTKNEKCLKPQAAYSFTPENRKKFLFPNKDMQKEFPDWFGSQIHQRHIDNDQDPEVSTTSELFALANGPSWTPISVNSCIVDGVRYVVHNRDERSITQSSGICSPGPDGEMYYGKGKRKPNLGGRGAGKLNTRDKTRNLSLKDIAKAKGPVSIHFDVGHKQTLNPLGPHAAHWFNYIGETLFDLRPHMESSRWTEIYEGINQHLQKAYNTNKASFKAKHWKVDPQTGTYDVEAIRRARPEEITADEWDNYIRFWNDPKNLARAAQNRQNRQKNVVISRQGSQSLARLRDELEEMKRLEATGVLHITGPLSRPSNFFLPALDKSLKGIHKKVDFMMSLFRSDSKYSDMFKEFESGGASGSGGCGDDEESGDDEDGDVGGGTPTLCAMIVYVIY